MSDSIMPEDSGPKSAAKRPRSTRYVGRKSREVLLPEELDDWISGQMNGRWSRNQVFEQCIGIAMGRVEAATATEDALAATLERMQGSIDGLAKQLRMIAAILTVDTKLSYLPPDAKKPATMAEHKVMVMETMNRMMKGDGE